MNLKSKASFDEMGFAYLISPEAAGVKSDAELYAAVHSAGRAVIRPFKGASYELLPAVSLTPQEFEKKWGGD